MVIFIEKKKYNRSNQPPKNVTENCYNKEDFQPFQLTKQTTVDCRIVSTKKNLQIFLLQKQVTENFPNITNQKQLFRLIFWKNGLWYELHKQF